MSAIEVRPARPEDWPIIAEFNRLLALETEDIRLIPEVLEAGVRALLSDPQKGRYFLACVDDQPVGQIMHTWEWSDWRNGFLWWLQSVYVAQPWRRKGVFQRLFTFLWEQAFADPQCVGMRLYVEHNNHAAQQTYRSFGFRPCGYHVLERLCEPPAT